MENICYDFSPVESPIRSMGGLIGGESQKLSEHFTTGKGLCGVKFILLIYIFPEYTDSVLSSPAPSLFSYSDLNKEFLLPICPHNDFHISSHMSL